MNTLRDKVADIIREAAHYDDGVDVSPFADQVLAIPEIAEAMAGQPTRVFGMEVVIDPKLGPDEIKIVQP
jgi:hypothetical protein